MKMVEASDFTLFASRGNRRNSEVNVVPSGRRGGVLSKVTGIVGRAEPAQFFEPSEGGKGVIDQFWFVAARGGFQGVGVEHEVKRLVEGGDMRGLMILEEVSGCIQGFAGDGERRHVFHEHSEAIDGGRANFKAKALGRRCGDFLDDLPGGKRLHPRK